MKFKVGDILDVDKQPLLKVLDIFHNGKYNMYKVQALTSSKEIRDVPCRFIDDECTLNPGSGPEQLNQDLIKLLKRNNV